MEQEINASELKFVTKKGLPFEVPVEGSLGLLALGYVGLMAWREKRQSHKQAPKQADATKGDPSSAKSPRKP